MGFLTFLHIETIPRALTVKSFIIPLCWKTYTVRTGKSGAVKLQEKCGFDSCLYTRERERKSYFVGD